MRFSKCQTEGVLSQRSTPFRIVLVTTFKAFMRWILFMNDIFSPLAFLRPKSRKNFALRNLVKENAQSSVYLPGRPPVRGNDTVLGYLPGITAAHRWGATVPILSATAYRVSFGTARRPANINGTRSARPRVWDGTAAPAVQRTS